MADNPIKSVTSLPPRTLMLIVGGGLAAGLVWRRMAGNKSSGFAVPSTLSAGDQSMQDLYNTAFETVGGDRRYMYGSNVPQPAAPSNGSILTQEQMDSLKDDYSSTPSQWESDDNFETYAVIQEYADQYGMSLEQFIENLRQQGYYVWTKNGSTPTLSPTQPTG